MAENAISILELRCSRRPTITQARLQNLICVRAMIPDSDRCDGPQSCGSKYDPELIPWHDQIVRELILNDKFCNDFGNHRSR